MIIEGPVYPEDVTITAFSSLEELFEAQNKIAVEGTEKATAFITHWTVQLSKAGCFVFFRQIIDGLITLCRRDPRKDETRAPFHNETPEGYKIKPVVRAYGEALNAIGGLGLMQAAAMCIRLETEDGAVLEYCWKGIGEWES